MKRIRWIFLTLVVVVALCASAAMAAGEVAELQEEPVSPVALLSEDESVLPALSTPTELRWGQTYDSFTGEWKTVPGAISWRSADSSKFEIKIFRVGEAEAVKTFSQESFIEQQYHCNNLFSWDDAVFTTGTYYFTVKALGDDVTCGDSEVACSDTWSYTRPSVQLNTSNPAWGAKGTMTWINQFTDTSLVDYYNINIYYSATENGEPEYVGSWWYYPGQPAVLPSYITGQYGVGYYYFTVQAYSNDVTLARPGAVSDRSSAYCYEAPPQLETPTELTWGMGRPGTMSWKPVESDQGQYELSLYKEEQDGTASLIDSTFFWLSEPAEYCSDDMLAEQIIESGTYYFTVQALGDGINNSDSDVAISPPWTYNSPDAKIGTPSSVAWIGRYLTWAPLSSAEHFYRYEVDVLYGETETSEPFSFCATYLSSVDQDQVFLWDYLFDINGAGYYYFRIRAISDDITAVHSSTWSELRKTYIGDETAPEQMQSIQESLPEDPTTGQIQAAIESVKAIDTDQLAAAMAADQNNSGTVKLIEQLDQAAQESGNVTVEVKVGDTQIGIDAEKVSIVGAGLNVGTSSEITLKIESPTADVTVPELYNDTVRFSMHLEGAKDADSETVGQQLAVPVKITLPIPADVNPSFLVILHYHEATGTWEEIMPYVYSSDGQWYADFVVTSFSDFAIVVDSEIPAEVEKTENGVAVTLQLTTEQSGSAICAAYDKNGKQLGAASLNTLTSGEYIVEIPCDAESVATVKVFLLDENSAPLHIASVVDLETEE